MLGRLLAASTHGSLRGVREDGEGDGTDKEEGGVLPLPQNHDTLTA